MTWFYVIVYGSCAVSILLTLRAFQMHRQDQRVRQSGRDETVPNGGPEDAAEVGE